MKVLITESKIGVEYMADVISSCNQNGVECIVDDKNGDIYYYDPKRHKYGDDRLLHDNDTSIWDIVKDKKLFDAIMFDASGAIFKDFAVKWNDLQKKGDEDEVFKTDHCNPIRGNFSEEGNMFNDKCLELNERDASRLGYFLKDMAQSYWEEDNMGGGSKSEMLVNLYSDALQWLRDAKLIQHDEVPGCIVVKGAKYPLKSVVKKYLDDAYEKTEVSERRQEVVTGKRKEDDDGLSDAGRAHLERIKNMKDDFGYRVNGIEAQVSESDDPRDWSSSEGEVEIVWTTSQYEDFGIFEGDTSTYVIDYDRVEDQEDLINEVCRLIGKEYPDLDFEVDDFEITNEKEFWSNRKGGRELADGVVEIEGIPDWAESYLVNGDDSGLSEEDKADVDKYVDELAADGLALAHPIDGTENEFDRHPAFGKACATSTWVANEI